MIGDTLKPDFRPSLWARIGNAARALDAAIDADPVADELSELKRRLSTLETRLDRLDIGPDSR